MPLIVVVVCSHHLAQSGQARIPLSHPQQDDSQVALRVDIIGVELKRSTVVMYRGTHIALSHQERC